MGCSVQSKGSGSREASITRKSPIWGPSVPTKSCSLRSPSSTVVRISTPKPGSHTLSHHQFTITIPSIRTISVPSKYVGDCQLYHVSKPYLQKLKWSKVMTQNVRNHTDKRTRCDALRVTGRERVTSATCGAGSLS